MRIEIYTQITALLHSCHEASLSAGWWEGEENSNLPTKICLIHSELSEAVEGIEEDLMDDKLPHRKMEEVEMADAFIRICDYMGRRCFKFRVADNTAEMRNPSEVERLAYVSRIHKSVSTAMEGLRKGNLTAERAFLCRALCMIVRYCEQAELNLFDAINEKMEFNKVRPDHKLEARKEEGGKSF